MRYGIIGSTVFHIAAILFMVFGLPRLEDDVDIQPDVIPMEIVNIADETVNKPTEEPAAEPTPEPVAVAAAAEPPPPVEDAAPPPPDEAAIPQKKPEPKKEEKPAPKTPNAAPMRKPKPPSRFDATKLALLIDKKLEQDAPQAKSKDSKKPQKPAESKPSQRSTLERTQMTASLQAAIRAQVEPCWSVPAGAKEAADLKVKIRLYLLPDGSLARPPEIVGGPGFGGSDYYRVAAESARRAVQRCAPLKLPAESYDIWRDSELTFDPKEMLGG